MGSSPQNVGILVFDEVEVLDFCGPFEVFATASDGKGNKHYKALIIAEEARTISCRGGLLVQPNFTFADHPKLDLLVIPGGYGTRREIDNPAVIDWLKRNSATAELTTSVCTGAYLLAKTGMLDGKRATTHWGAIADFRQSFPSVTTVDDKRVIDEGKVITSAGVSAGIDMALYVVGRQHGHQIAVDTARDMEYDWREA